MTRDEIIDIFITAARLARPRPRLRRLSLFDPQLLNQPDAFVRRRSSSRSSLPPFFAALVDMFFHVSHRVLVDEDA